jgi:hypothetical protein
MCGSYLFSVAVWSVADDFPDEYLLKHNLLFLAAISWGVAKVNHLFSAGPSLTDPAETKQAYYHLLYNVNIDLYLASFFTKH